MGSPNSVVDNTLVEQVVSSDSLFEGLAKFNAANRETASPLTSPTLLLAEQLNTSPTGHQAGAGLSPGNPPPPPQTRPSMPHEMWSSTSTSTPLFSKPGIW